MPDLYNPNDGVTGRDGGPYLDQLQLEEAERRRAEIEGREPNFERPGSIAGVTLVDAQRLVETANNLALPSQAAHRDQVLGEALGRLADDAVGASPVSFEPDSEPVTSDEPLDPAGDTFNLENNGN